MGGESGVDESVKKGESHFSEMRSFARSLMLIKPPLSPAKLFEKKNAECCSPARAGFSTTHAQFS